MTPETGDFALGPAEAASVRAADDAALRAELARARAQVAAAQNARNEFLANITHELRTPIAGVIGMTELLLGTALDARQRHYTHVAKASAEMLLALVNDLIDLALLESGGMTLAPSEFHVWAAVESAVGVVAPKSGQKDLEISCFVHPSIPPIVRGDEARLRQILVNLASNAVKFTQRGEVSVRAEPVDETADELVVRFSVRDTGIGIAAEKRERLFQPFSRLDALATRAPAGAGVGLRIAKRLCALMGGEIGVESEPGEGATFWFTARFGRVDRPVDIARRRLNGDMSGVRTLLVDDNATTRAILEIWLRNWGAEVESASNGPDAIALLRAADTAGRPFRLAVLDEQLPGANGEQVGREIVGDARLRGTRVIMLTTFGDAGMRARLSAIGFAGLATKPVSEPALFDLVLKALAAPPPEGTGSQQAVPAARRALLAQDDEVSRQGTAAVLAGLGYECEHARDGRAAVEAARRRRFDLVLLDVRLPIVGGMDAAQAIRAGEAAATSGVSPSRVPIVALADGAQADVRRKCLDAGMDEFVVKPVSSEKLAAAVERLLRAVAPAAAPRAERQPTAVAERAVPDGAPIAVAGLAAPIDARSLAERCLSNVDLVERLIDRFRVQAGEAIDQIRGAVDRQVSEDARRLAHALKGVAANLSAEALRAAAADLETAARDGDLSRGAAQVDRLKQEFDRCLTAIPWVLCSIRGT